METPLLDSILYFVSELRQRDIPEEALKELREADTLLSDVLQSIDDGDYE